MAASGARLKEISIGFMGDVGAGKTALARSFMGGVKSLIENNKIEATLSCCFHSSQVSHGNTAETYKLKLTDISGKSNFQNLAPVYLSDSDIIFVVYDITNKLTFNSLNKDQLSIIKAKNPNCIFVLVGAKSDLVYERGVSKEEEKAKAKVLGIDEKFCFEVSAKSGANIQDCLHQSIAEALRLRPAALAPAAVEPAPEPKPEPSFLERAKMTLQRFKNLCRADPQRAAFIGAFIGVFLFLGIAAAIAISIWLWPIILNSAIAAAIIAGTASAAGGLAPAATIGLITASVCLVADGLVSFIAAKIAGFIAKPIVEMAVGAGTTGVTLEELGGANKVNKSQLPFTPKSSPTVDVNAALNNSSPRNQDSLSASDDDQEKLESLKPSY